MNYFIVYRQTLMISFALLFLILISIWVTWPAADMSWKRSSLLRIFLSMCIFTVSGNCKYVFFIYKNKSINNSLPVNWPQFRASLLLNEIRCHRNGIDLSALAMVERVNHCYCIGLIIHSVDPASLCPEIVKHIGVKYWTNLVTST